MANTKDILKNPKVYFDGNFWTRFKWERVGKRIPVQQRFMWDWKYWLIPAVYSCSKGLVIDFCIQIPSEELQEFYKKWENADYAALSKEEKQDIEKTNPMAYDFGAYLWLNETKISYTHGCVVGWNPFSENGDECVKTLLHLYRLDTSKAWLIQRKAFPWIKKKASKIDTLSVELEQELQVKYGPRICVTKENRSFDFIFPSTGKLHSLKVLEYNEQEFDPKIMPLPDHEIPLHCVSMTYTVKPELQEGTFTITDCEDSDKPIIKNSEHGQAGAVAIIGGADQIMSLSPQEKGEKLHTVYSSLHFAPRERVEWQMKFYERTIKNGIFKVLEWKQRN